MADSHKPLLKQNLERHLKNLPVLPTVVASLMTLDSKKDTYFDDVLALIETDPGYSARILSAANSVASGATEPVTTLRAAISRLGSVGASNLVTSMSVARVFVPKDDWEKSLWRHAIQVAVAARGLATKLNDPDLSPDVAYTCGLLHDIGRFVMFQEAPEELRLVDEGDWDNATELVETEMAICGLNHADLGAMACERWHLPDLVVQVVRDHHTNIQQHTDGQVGRLTSLVYVADLAMFPSATPGEEGLERMSDQELRDGLLAKLPSWIQFELSELRIFLLESATEANEALTRLGLG